MIRVCENSTVDHEDRFTVGTVLQTLSSISQTRHAKNKDKHLIRENIIRALQQEVIFQNRFPFERPRKLSSAKFAALRESLKEQVEITKTKPKKPHYVNKPWHNNHEEDDFYIFQGDGLASVSQDLQNKTSITLDQDEDQGLQSFVMNNFSNSEEASDRNNSRKEMLIKYNVYSRHLQNNAKDSEVYSSENDELVDGLPECSTTNVEESSQRPHNRRSRRESFASSIISNISTPSRKRSQSQASEEIKQQDKEKRTNEEERNFISGISDPTLKDSMQKIVQRRKSVLCLFKSSGGLKVLNENEAFDISPIEEESSSTTSEFGSESVKSENSVNCDEAKSEGCNYGYPSLKVDETDPTCLPSDASLPLNAKLDSNRKGILKQQPQLGRRFKQKSHSARTICTRNNIETEETKMIMPLSAKTWRPTLVPQQPKKRSNTAYSCPETRKEKKKMFSDKSKDDAIRDFIIMYAKVKSKRRPEQEEVDRQREVQMISKTPEFVVKSAIGHFITSPFPPSDRSNVHGNSEEKYEAKQKTKLIKIKNCMLQLADLA